MCFPVITATRKPTKKTTITRIVETDKHKSSTSTTIPVPISIKPIVETVHIPTYTAPPKIQPVYISPPQVQPVYHPSLRPVPIAPLAPMYPPPPAQYGWPFVSPQQSYGGIRGPDGRIIHTNNPQNRPGFGAASARDHNKHVWVPAPTRHRTNLRGGSAPRESINDMIDRAISGGAALAQQPFAPSQPAQPAYSSSYATAVPPPGANVFANVFAPDAAAASNPSSYTANRIDPVSAHVLPFLNPNMANLDGMQFVNGMQYDPFNAPKPTYGQWKPGQVPGSNHWQAQTPENYAYECAQAMKEKQGKIKPLIPQTKDISETFWVWERDGQFSLQTASFIAENCQPGHWIETQGYQVFVRD